MTSANPSSPTAPVPPDVRTESNQARGLAMSAQTFVDPFGAEARDRVLLYTRGMPLDPVFSVDLALQSLRRVEENPDASRCEGLDRIAATMDATHALMREHGISLQVSDSGKLPLCSTPPMNRRAMIAEELDTSPIRTALKKLFRGKKEGDSLKHQPRKPPKPDGPPADWELAGGRRRKILTALIVLPSLLAAQIMYGLLPASGSPPLMLTITALFAVLFCWISVGFWTSVGGMLLLFRRVDRFSPSSGLPYDLRLPRDVRTALLFPVYNENIRAVCAGIRAVYQSLRKQGLLESFDIFILSDSTNPEAWIQEEEAWFSLCGEEDAFGRIFYRRRKSNLKRKSGNIADFCRRWGANYRYMIIFDADSLMSAETLARMVQIMELHPRVGILQSPPKAIKSRSLLARVQQFSNHLYGPIFAAGLHYWQLGDAQYWGHNAIIRLEPFMRHCQLPILPGKSRLGGEIMSHDFVESALMRRAGYSVWLAYGLEGSYEQTPPTLIDELVRDRRWCQGNLQHSRLIFTRGFFPTHRALFINGILSYGSALLWLLFLVASSAQAIAELFVIPSYFPPEPSLFPDWPKYFPNWALTLLSGTAALLFLPKVLSVILVMVKGGAKAFGGYISMTLGVLGEVLVSTLLAPVRMLFHSWFVIGALLGRSFGWNAQNRGDSGTTWGDAIRFHWWGTLLGGVWGWFMYLINPGFFLWLSPIVIGLVLSVPLSVWTSRVSWGEGAQKVGLFFTPVDSQPSEELVELEKNLERPLPYSPFFLPPEAGFIRASVIPSVFSLHTTLVNHRRHDSPQKLQWLRSLADKALERGPGALNNAEKIAVLSNPDCLAALHRAIWIQDKEQARRWGIR